MPDDLTPPNQGVLAQIRDALTRGLAADPTLGQTAPGLGQYMGHIAQGIGQTVAYPGEVYQQGTQGQTPTPEQMIPWSASTALSLAGSNMPFAEPGGAGIFGGRLALTADKAMLKRAMEMEQGGAAPEDVWSQTGWFQGPDKGWRFEIPDKGTKLMQIPKSRFGTRVAPLGVVLQHPGGLFEAYPQLTDMPTIYNAPLGRDTLAAYSPTGIAAAGTAGKPTMVLNTKPTASTALHEIQHAVQDIEGFPGGGGTSVKLLQPDMPAWDIYQKNLADLTREHGIPSREEFSKQLGLPGLMGEDTYNTAVTGMNRKIDAIARQQAMYDYYKRLSGEVEARNVQARLPMGPALRKKVYPWVSQDVPTEEQFVRQRERAKPPEEGQGGARMGLLGVQVGQAMDPNAPPIPTPSVPWWVKFVSDSEPQTTYSTPLPVGIRG